MMTTKQQAQYDALITASNTLALLCNHCAEFKSEHGSLLAGKHDYCPSDGYAVFEPHPEAAILREMAEALRVSVEGETDAQFIERTRH